MCYNSFVFFVAGMDLLKHGESAYPADAWVEQQYMQDFSMEVRDDWEMLNFWKSFVNGFTYNQVGKQNNYYLQCKFDLFGGRKKQQQKIVSMLLLFDISVPRALTNTRSSSHRLLCNSYGCQPLSTPHYFFQSTCISSNFVTATT